MEKLRKKIVNNDKLSSPLVHSLVYQRCIFMNENVLPRGKLDLKKNSRSVNRESGVDEDTES